MTDQIERIRERVRLTRLYGTNNQPVDADWLLAEVDRLNDEIDAWRARWRESQAEIARLERIVAGMT